MRIVTLLPLALAALAAGGCRTASEGTEQAALGVPQRDLTLQQTPAPEVEIASPVELARAPTERSTTQRPRRTHRPAPAPHPEANAPEDAPATLSPTPAPAQPAATALAASAPEAADPHALAPGQSVTIIPASSGPTTPEDWTDERPSGRERGVEAGGGGHGGRCKPRGTGMPGRGLPAAFR
jgi:translation initiation factor IF-2